MPCTLADTFLNTAPPFLLKVLLASTAAPATAYPHGLIVISVDAVKDLEPSELDCLIAHEAAHVLLFHHAEKARPLA